MLTISLASAKPKEAYGLLFEQAFLEGSFGKGCFVNANPQSKLKLGALSGLLVYAVPNEMVVLAVKVAGSRDAIVVLNFFSAGSGTKLVINAVNIPESAKGDAVVKELESILRAYGARYPK
jgi:hypothetical protein